MNRVFLTAYYVVVSVLLVRALLNGAEWYAYYDFTSLSLVIAPSLLSYGLSRNVKWAMLGALYGALVGLVLSLYLTFSHGAIDTQSILVGVSISLLPMLYAAIVALLLFPLHISIKK